MQNLLLSLISIKWNFNPIEGKVYNQFYGEIDASHWRRLSWKEIKRFSSSVIVRDTRQIVGRFSLNWRSWPNNKTFCLLTIKKRAALFRLISLAWNLSNKHDHKHFQSLSTMNLFMFSQTIFLTIFFFFSLLIFRINLQMSPLTPWRESIF